MRRKNLLALLALILVMLPAATAGVASAHSGDVAYSNWTTSPPTIDGNPATTPYEWADAYVNTVIMGSYTVPIALKNDAINLYASFSVADLVNPSGDFLIMMFDDQHDGVLTAGGEDGKQMQGSLFRDLCWMPAWLDDTTTLDGQGAAAWSAGTGYTFEFSVPLASGDAQDLAASPGDTLGLAALYFDVPESADHAWPTYQYSDATSYADLVLASGPTPPTSVAYSNWTTSPPTIDGNPATTPNEWADAYVNTVTMGSYTVPIALKNDAINLYASFSVADLVDPSNDPLIMMFDDQHDGVLTDGGEDAKQVSGGFVDYYWMPTWMPDTTTVDGEGARTWSAGYTFEFSVPLASGDSQDLAASPGDILGIVAAYYDVSESMYHAWPTYDFSNATSYGDLVLASGPMPTPTPTPTPTSTPTPFEECFIATAASGADDSGVDILRTFRDSYMANNPVGSALTSTYYRLSPPIAEFIDEHPALKPAVRAALLPAVAVSEVAVGTGWVEKVAVVSGLAVLTLASLAWLRKRRARGPH